MGTIQDRFRKYIAGCDVTLVIFIFFLLFAPPIIPQINTALFAAVYAGVMLLVKYRKDLLSALKASGMLRFAIGIGIFLAYIGAITVINWVVGERVQLMHYIKLWYRFLMIVPVLLVCCLFICLRARELNYTVYDLGMCFVYATLIQFLLALLALVIPEVKDFFISIIYANTGDEYLGIAWVTARRGFGFSNSFVDSFGFGMGIIAALPLFFIKEKRLYNLYFVPCLLLVSFLNVRTGLILAALGCVIALPSMIRAFLKMDTRGKTKTVITVVAVILLLVLLIGLVLVCNPVTVRWILGDVVDMFVSIADIPVDEYPEYTENTWLQPDSDTTTADTLFSPRFWNLPSGWTVLFGSGHTIYGADGYENSDVGYVNDLWLGGLVGCLLLYGAFALLFIQAFRCNKSWGTRSLILFFIVSILVFQVKANAIMFNAGLNTILPLTFYICFCTTSEERKCLLKKG